jgi:hypothetical protein
VAMIAFSTKAYRKVLSMMNDKFQYKNETYQSGDCIICKIFGALIEDAKIYVCSKIEKQIVTLFHDDYSVIIFICSDINHDGND